MSKELKKILLALSDILLFCITKKSWKFLKILKLIIMLHYLAYMQIYYSHNMRLEKELFIDFLA